MLPYDIARCLGVGEEGDWREGCEDCLRRLAPSKGDNVADIDPPPGVVFVCEFYVPSPLTGRAEL